MPPNNWALSYHDNVVVTAEESSVSSTKPRSQWTDIQVDNNLIDFVMTNYML